MKTLNLTALAALTAVSLIASAPAQAQTPAWAAIAANPVPSYQPFRGYAGSPTYIGQDYSTLGGGGGSFDPVEALTGDGDGDGDSPLDEVVDHWARA